MTICSIGGHAVGAKSGAGDHRTMATQAYMMQVARIVPPTMQPITVQNIAAQQHNRHDIAPQPLVDHRWPERTFCDEKQTIRHRCTHRKI